MMNRVLMPLTILGLAGIYLAPTIARVNNPTTPPEARYEDRNGDGILDKIEYRHQLGLSGYSEYTLYGFKEQNGETVYLSENQFRSRTTPKPSRFSSSPFPVRP